MRMPTKPIERLVRELRRLNAAYARLDIKRTNARMLTKSYADIDKVHKQFQPKADELSGKIMRLERHIITALLGETK